MAIESDGKEYDDVSAMFADMKKDFKDNHPVQYWIDHSLFPSGGLFGYAPHVFFMCPWIMFEYFFGEFKHAWQRVFRGWDDTVIWSIDWYLAKKIPLWIKALKEKGHGIPTEMFDGLPHDDNYCYSDENEKIAENRWFDILDKIARGFESYHKIQEECLYEKDPEFSELNKNYEIGFDLFKEYFQSLWD